MALCGTHCMRVFGCHVCLCSLLYRHQNWKWPQVDCSYFKKFIAYASEFIEMVSLDFTNAKKNVSPSPPPPPLLSSKFHLKNTNFRFILRQPLIFQRYTFSRQYFFSIWFDCFVKEKQQQPNDYLHNEIRFVLCTVWNTRHKDVIYFQWCDKKIVTCNWSGERHSYSLIYSSSNECCA